MSLKKMLKNSKVRKIFGRKEIEIIEKQLEGLKLTQSEKNRLSRDIRPKFEVIKELSGCEDEFNLKKNSSNMKIIEKAKKVILNHDLKDAIEAIFLFGSFADKTYTKRSDIDICVLFKKDISQDDATKFRIRVLGDLPDKADIQVFNILPIKIKRDIARNHKVLYKAEGYDNTDFSIRYLKDEDYLIRMKRIFGAEA